MTKHDEFPPLSPTAERFLLNVYDKIDSPKHSWQHYRLIVAAVIHEALRQPDTLSELLAIAYNLHALPPEPPLKKQALDIWDQVEGEVSYRQARIMRAALALIPDPTP